MGVKVNATGEIIDWAELWRNLAQMHRDRQHPSLGGADLWQERARSYQARVEHRWAKPDSSREVIAAYLAAAPEATIVDIGAGTGAWVVYLAPRAARITALEPSPAMLAVLREVLVTKGISNVATVQASWPDAEVALHDFSLCAHAMYSAVDLPAFVRRIEQVTRRTCFMVFRAPSADGVMAEATRRIWGHPYDSPNFQVAYNVLLQMGIHANVRFEESPGWAPWTSATLDEALNDVKRRMMLDTAEHDLFLLDLLRRRLHQEGGQLVWPRAIRSALVYWQAGER
jgi:SAM-dependent methyltransferase